MILTQLNTFADDLKIGILDVKPFAYQENGIWKGLSVDLVEQLSKEQGFTYQFVANDNIVSHIDVVKNGDVDFSLSAIFVTHERERVLDFSHPYFTSSLGILSKDKSSNLENFIWMGKQIFIVFSAFIVLIYIVGFAIKKVEHNENIASSHEGAWWALVTFTTTGYGDLVPKTNKGKFIASIWMISSIFLLSLFTGYIASSMTVKRLSESHNSLVNLYDARVAVVSGSTAQLKLNSLYIKTKGVKNLAMALKLFKTKKVDIVVYDEAILKHMAQDIQNTTVHTIDNSAENYAIAFPSNSPLKEQINLGILKILTSEQWKMLQLKYNVL